MYFELIRIYFRSNSYNDFHQSKFSLHFHLEKNDVDSIIRITSNFCIIDNNPIIKEIRFWKVIQFLYLFFSFFVNVYAKLLFLDWKCYWSRLDISNQYMLWWHFGNKMRNEFLLYLSWNQSKFVTFERLSDFEVASS